jgi:adenylate cyclase
VPVLLSVLYFLGAYWYLVLGLHVLPPMTGPVLAILATYLAVVLSLYLEERQGRLQVRHVFQHYVPSHVVERLERDPDLLQAPGQKQELTILFSDIRNFTTLAERIGPEATVSLLNRYFEAMTQVILECDGKIDKFVGDAILAVFGEPVSTGNHAEQALEAALGMRRALRRLNADPEFRAIMQSDEPLDIGVGINTGEVIVGNLGAAQRKDYTVIGDAVNLCSRLEGLAKGDNPRLILSEATYLRTKGKVDVVSLGEVVVKGKTKAVQVFGVHDEGEDDKMGEEQAA